MDRKHGFNIDKLTGPLTFPQRMPDAVRAYPGNGRLRRYINQTNGELDAHIKYCLGWLGVSIPIGLPGTMDMINHTHTVLGLLSTVASVPFAIMLIFHGSAMIAGANNLTEALKLRKEKNVLD